MGNWIPNDPTLVAQILKVSSSYASPQPEGFISPMTWGIEDDVIERFAAAGVPKDKIAFERDKFTFNNPGAPSALRRQIPKLLRADHECLRSGSEERATQTELQAELETLFDSQNTSPREEITLHPG